MKTLHAFLAGALLAAHIGAAAAAGPGDLGNLSGQTFGISNTLQVAPGLPRGRTFSDEYLFDLSAASLTNGTSVTLSMDMWPTLPGAEFDLTNMVIRFVAANGTILASDSQSGAADTTLTISNLLLPAAHDYKFVVSGTVSGSLGGSYGGVLQALPMLVAAPVPEVDTYAFIALGIGLVGLLTGRKDSSSYRRMRIG